MHIIKQISVARNNQTTKTELYAEIVNGLEPFTISAKSSILDVGLVTATPPNPLENRLKIVIILKRKNLFQLDIIGTKI